MQGDNLSLCGYRGVASSCHEEGQAGVGALGLFPRQVRREQITPAGSLLVLSADNVIMFGSVHLHSQIDCR